MGNARLDKAQAGIKMARRNVNNLTYANDAILKAETEEELKNILTRVKEESEKAEENGIETYKISCMKRVASPGLIYDTWCLGLVHWDDPEGWYGEGGGFRMGNTCIPVVDSFRYLAKLIQFCKV